MPRKFRNPDPNYQSNHFLSTSRPKSPSPKRKNYSSKAVTSDDGVSRCTFIHPRTLKRCRNKLGLYPQFCALHTMMIDNIYVAPSQIPNAGNGLYAGPYGFKKGDIIGKYSFSHNEVPIQNLEKRCDNDSSGHCWSYVFCDAEKKGKTKCWDGLDIRSTWLRFANDAHKSTFHNNAYFDVVKGQVYAIASRNIKPKSEILVSYGPDYWKYR